MTRVIPKQFVDPKTGQLTREALLYLNDLDNNDTTGVTAIGTLLSGVAQKTDGIIAGTVALEDVVIAQRGRITDELDSLGSNVNAVSGAASGSALTASASSFLASGYQTTAGTVTTSTVTVTPSGGTPPYTFAWTRASGPVFAIGDDDGAATSFSIFLDTGSSAYGVYRCTVTDDAAATYALDFSVSAQVKGTSSGGGIIP